ncbi:MAG: RdgB/HAM1 family non-canonical purine NTP pyrophosphatase [Alphaproteobacteria bacterium]|nr:RdgB/HAM1 family non-canonical purine NTP pyrophosphatase [Alphaproteobacteria bacterium]
MARAFTERRLVIASHNPGKVREIAELLAPYALDMVSAAAFGLPEPEETQASFAGNAALKAHAASRTSGLAALADDSGLVVPALGDAPGIYSARWAGESRDFAAAMARVEKGLAGQVDRRAEFVAALALAWPDGHLEQVEGRVEGSLVWPPRGGRGFGYDPMFQPTGYVETFGEMAGDLKHSISHRAVAFAKLIALCFRR